MNDHHAPTPAPSGRRDRRAVRRGGVALVLGAALVTAAGCSSVVAGPTTTQERDVEGVRAVDLRTSGTLTIELGEAPSLTVTARENVIDELTSEVDDGTLVLGREGGPRWGTPGRIEYTLVVTELEALAVRGSGDVEADDVAGERLSVTVEGSGDVVVEAVEVGTLDAQVAGSGGLTLAGRADAQNVVVEGSGSYDGGDLETREAVIAVRGSGGADVHVTRRLDVQVDGSGSVRHTGGAEVTSDVDGSGDVVGY
ncbi:DUF2807 domain-containing protein [Cellulomonas sp. APG4]|uniref:head GIN domain-containing protein n=1 Tax=Cellulomonas sp. APG4 TaxID=1538656 RepID=UPI00137A142B|nr:DUF2807 domain-containing protein [Cellulomonas sp. APG4]